VAFPAAARRPRLAWASSARRGTRTRRTHARAAVRRGGGSRPLLAGSAPPRSARPAPRALRTFGRVGVSNR
jgi:hypothetical protein